MLYRDIHHVSVVGLRGTLYVDKSAAADRVAVETDGPYEAQAVDDSCLVIGPEGHEPAQLLHAGTPVTAGGTHVGSVDVTAHMQFGTRRARRPRVRAGARVKATVRIAAPPNTSFELRGCHGLRKGPGGWHFMEGSSRFITR